MICAIALGPVPPALKNALLTGLPGRLPVGWTVEDVGDTTEELLTRAAESPEWTTLLITPMVSGQPPLPNALAAIMKQFPTLRVALYGTDGAPMRTLIGSIAGYGLTNVLFDDPAPTLGDLVALVTTDYERRVVNTILSASDDVAVKAAEPLGLGPVVAASPKSPGAVRTIRDRVIAIISGKGGAGKTSVTANLFAVGAGGEAVAAFDANWAKASLWMHFFDHHTPPTYAEFGQLATTIEQAHGHESTEEAIITARDREECRKWVDLCVANPVLGGILLPGPRRESPQFAEPLDGVYSEVLRQVRDRATVTFVDAPLPSDPTWPELVRQADKLVLVVTPELEQVLEATDVLAKLDRLAVPVDRVSLVINRRAKWGLPTAAIQLSLNGLPVLAEIPDQPAVWEEHRARHRPMALDRPDVWRTLYGKLTALQAPRRKGWRPARRLRMGG